MVFMSLKMLLIYQKVSKVAVVSFIPRYFGGGSYHINELSLKVMGISHIKLFLIFRKQKSRHIDSTNSGRTFHPLAQFALKLCNGLNFKL